MVREEVIGQKLMGCFLSMPRGTTRLAIHRRGLDPVVPLTHQPIRQPQGEEQGRFPTSSAPNPSRSRLGMPRERLAAYFDAFTKRFLRDGSPLP